MSRTPEPQPLVYDVHVFCCINQRPPDHPRGSCAARGSEALQAYMKGCAKELGIERIRVNKAGCLERCELGPALVIYPQATWYTYADTADVDEILERHVIGGETVARLRLDVDQTLLRPRRRAELELRVTAVRRLTPEIKMFELGMPDDAELPAFTAGSHVDVLMPSGLRRSYSLANDPAERRRYVLAVRRETDGAGSAWMHKLDAGDAIRVLAPLNGFALVEDAALHVLVAGGIGITPILAMGHRLHAIGARARLHYCTRDADNTAFAETVRDVFGEAAAFHHDGGDPARGIDLERLLAAPVEGAHLYVCGPAGLMEAARAAARDWPAGAVHMELFQPPVRPAPAPGEAFEVLLSRRGTSLTVPADGTFLEAVLGAGVDVDWACEDGVCGACRTRLLSGRAEHRDAVLGTGEKASNAAIMICCSRALPGETLILDL